MKAIVSFVYDYHRVQVDPGHLLLAPLLAVCGGIVPNQFPLDRGVLNMQGDLFLLHG